MEIFLNKSIRDRETVRSRFNLLEVFDWRQQNEKGLISAFLFYKLTNLLTLLNQLRTMIKCTFAELIRVNALKAARSI